MPTYTTKDIFKKCFIEPVTKHKCNHLKFVTGYITLEALEVHRFDIREADLLIEGIFGMSGRSEHRDEANKIESYQREQKQTKILFSEHIDMHIKSYLWYKNEKPFLAFDGSANYTKGGFGDSKRERREHLTSIPTEELENFAKGVEGYFKEIHNNPYLMWTEFSKKPRKRHSYKKRYEDLKEKYENTKKDLEDCEACKDKHLRERNSLISFSAAVIVVSIICSTVAYVLF